MGSTANVSSVLVDGKSRGSIPAASAPAQRSRSTVSFGRNDSGRSVAVHLVSIDLEVGESSICAAKSPLGMKAWLWVV
jgi:hypothetical protein